MKLMIITPRFPFPPDKGDRLTIFNYLKHLSKRHEIILFTFIQKGEEKFIEEIQPFCREIFTARHNIAKALWNCARWSAIGLKPLQISFYFDQSTMKNCVQDYISKNDVDLIYCHTIRMAEYVKDIQSVPKVLALQISMRLNYRRLKQYTSNILKKLFFSIESALVKDYEYDICQLFDKRLLISEKDLNEIQDNNRRKLENIHFLPHGVAHEYFKRKFNEENDGQTIIMTGNMGYPPNQDGACYFCEEIFPMVKKAEPGCKLLIVGKNPTNDVKKFHNGESITVTGAVDDIRPYLESASICAVPIRIAAGLQNKLIEGMSMELPVVATSNANEGIKAVPERHILTADNARDFSDKIIELLRDKEKREVLGRNARNFIEEQFTWEYFLNDLENIMIGLCGENEN